MIINPKEILEKGYLKADKQYAAISDKQVQQAGIDIRAGRVFTVSSSLITITETEKPKFESLYREIFPDPRGLIRLEPGYAYSIDSMEYIKVPKDMSAFVLHRSTFNRIGALITGSTYDPGFQGNVGVTMYAFNRIEIAIGTRVAQVLFVKTDSAASYAGGYQNQKGHEQK